jgi:hypothetical protein
MQLRLISVFFLSFFCVFSSYGVASQPLNETEKLQEKKESRFLNGHKEEKSDEKGSVVSEKKEKTLFNVPEWAKRIDFEVDLYHRRKPNWMIETIQPLYRTKDTYRQTYFFQGRGAYRNSNGTFNLGLGYRYLFPKEFWLLGINSFYDVTTKETHQRWSIGGEVFNPYLTLRGNYYKAISGTKTAHRRGGFWTTEKALDGWDIEGELPLPYFPWLHLTGQYFFWDGEHAKNRKGYQITLLANIMDNLSLELGTNHSNYHTENFILLSFRLGRPQRVEFTLFRNPEDNRGFVPRSVRLLTLEKVRRQNEIILEKREQGSNGINIGRLDI